jgi:hypothetical protein
MSAAASLQTLVMSAMESPPPGPTQRWTLYVITRNRDKAEPK